MSINHQKNYVLAKRYPPSKIPKIYRHCVRRSAAKGSSEHYLPELKDKSGVSERQMTLQTTGLPYSSKPQSFCNLWTRKPYPQVCSSSWTTIALNTRQHFKSNKSRWTVLSKPNLDPGHRFLEENAAKADIKTTQGTKSPSHYKVIDPTAAQNQEPHVHGESRGEGHKLEAKALRMCRESGDQ